ncbi:flagellin [Falsiroseomonas oryzae]|uniref:flagellin n=1 Tax=Falsiroseomonas oryzae TaxID=2766473 RepID=UPI0022EA423B|nr:flagellin [Roseomonas sp. MO-31]
MSVISTIGGMALDQARLRLRLDELGRQVSTGQRGETHGALGQDARLAIDLRGDLARRDAYVGAADAALGRMDATQGVLARLESIASDIAAEAQRARTFGQTAVQSLARSARSALEEAAALLNTRHGGEYLFAGSDLAQAPVPNAAGIATGPLATAIAAEVAALTPANAALVLANTAAAAIAPATAPFNAHLEGPGLAEPRRAVQVADNERIAWGVLPSEDQAGQVAGAWGRELLRGLATLAALTPASAAQGQGYDALLVGVAQGLSGATAGIAQERGALGAAEKRVEASRERHRDLMVAMRAQLARVEEVDLAEASATLRQTRLRLEASYETTATISRLSLASLLR